MISILFGKYIPYRILRRSSIRALIEFFILLINSSTLGGLTVDLEDQRLRHGRFWDSVRILEVFLGSALDLVRVLLEELIEHVRIESRGLNERISPMVLVARDLLDHPLVLVLMFVPRTVVQRIRGDCYRVLKDPQIVGLRFEHFRRVRPHLHEIPGAAMRSSQRQDRKEQAHRSPRRHLKHEELYFVRKLRILPT